MKKIVIYSVVAAVLLLASFWLRRCAEDGKPESPAQRTLPQKAL